MQIIVLFLRVLIFCSFLPSFNMLNHFACIQLSFKPNDICHMGELTSYIFKIPFNKTRKRIDFIFILMSEQTNIIP